MTARTEPEAAPQEVPDLGVTCGYCPARFPFGGYDLFADLGYPVTAPLWTYSAEDGTWLCPGHSSVPPWWPPHDGEQRLADEDREAIAGHYAAVEAGPEPDPEPDPERGEDVLAAAPVFWADPVPDTDSEPTTWFTKIFARIGSRS